MNPVQADIILVPEAERDRPVSSLAISVRLGHILQYRNIQRLGDLHGLTLDELAKFRNCGAKTIRELRGLVGLPEKINRSISIPPQAQNINPFELPISARLARLLVAINISRLGDLQGCNPKKFRSVESVGRETICELENLLQRVSAGEFWPPTEVFTTDQTAELLQLIDTSIATLPKSALAIIQMRFGPGSADHSTFEKASQILKVSRERVRQIEAKALSLIKKATGPKLGCQLRGLAGICVESWRPLTPALLTRWVGESADKLRWPPAAYIHLMGTLCPQIPVWPQGQEPRHIPEANRPIIAAMSLVLCKNKAALPFSDAYEQVCACLGKDKPTVLQFLEILKHSHLLAIDLSEDGQGSVRLRRVQVSDAVKAVLNASKCALTPAVIQSKASEDFGSQLTVPVKGLFKNLRGDKYGIFQLGPDSFGLPRHIKLPSEFWKPARNIAYSLLTTKKRPISTLEIIATRQFEWVSHPNKYELACLLRGDKRFVDLGHYCFGLAEWGVAVRVRPFKCGWMILPTAA